MSRSASAILLVASTLAFVACGKSADDEEGDGGGGEAGAPTGTGGGMSTGGGGASAGSGAAGGSGGAVAGSGGMDPCAPVTCKSIEDCTPVEPASALITDFSNLSDTNVFHSGSDEWWLEFFGGPYVYPGFDHCLDTQPPELLAANFSAETFHVTGRVGTYAGAGVWFAPCNVDLSGYAGFSFTVGGNVGPSASLIVFVGTAENSAPSTDPRNPSCHPNQDRCIPDDPAAPWLNCTNGTFVVSDIAAAPRTVTMLWEDVGGGMPSPTTNPAEIRGIGFALDWSAGYTAADAYDVDFTLDDFMLVE